MNKSFDIENICVLKQVSNNINTWYLLIDSVCRDVDETKDWIYEKDIALNNDNYGTDLSSVQALQRKHEGVERDLAALGEKVRKLLKENHIWCIFPMCFKF